MKKFIVLNHPRSWKLGIDDVEVVSAKEYLTSPAYADMKNIRVFNLCNDYKYQSKGYYVSLLAEARGHKSIPNIKTMQDFKAPAIVRVISEELDDLLQKSLGKIKSNEFILSIYFGKNIAKQHARLSHELYQLFQAPLMRARFVFNKKWTIQSIRPIAFKDIPDYHMEYVEAFAKDYFSKKRYASSKESKFVFDLAILVNPEEASPPSDKKAIQKFIEAGESLGFSVELITKSDYDRVGEFDALFIRETTSVNHHTYKFARRAQSEGLAVLDDPDSILRCTNKVYLSELLAKAKIPTPKTMVVHAENKNKLAGELGFPCVLKLPDSSFSQGVVKVKTADELKVKLNKMLASSDLIIAQAYTPTDFDWRIGVLDGKVLYACKYYMAKGHWQIYNWSGDKNEIEGNFDTYPLEEVPPYVLDTAIKATSLIGKGLYGVDIKEIDGKAYVIEVNDNPSLDYNIEDQILKNELYLSIIRVLKQKIEEKIGKGNGNKIA